MSARELVGVVVKISGVKTCKVRVNRVYSCRIYKKVMRTWKFYLVHDENSVSVVGDSVLIRESSPISCAKRWVLVSKLG